MACISTTGWNRTDTISPEQDMLVDWISPSGEEITGGEYNGRLWFLPNGMYVYYTPIFWRPSKESI